jgi:hypothetical protein
MRISPWVSKATDTHPYSVIRIAFPRQQWLRERASMLPYTPVLFNSRASCTNSTGVGAVMSL